MNVEEREKAGSVVDGLRGKRKNDGQGDEQGGREAGRRAGGQCRVQCRGLLNAGKINWGRLVLADDFCVFAGFSMSEFKVV